jgi:hypothetical protein
MNKISVRQHIRGIILATFIFISCLRAITLWEIYRDPVNNNIEDVIYLTNRKLPPTLKLFKAVGHACGGAETITGYKSSDGVYLSRTYGGY